MYKTSIIAAVALAALPFASANNAGITDPVQGYKNAQAECASCHVIDPEPRRTLAELPAKGPGVARHFKSIAFDPAMTPDKIREILRLPHGEMANVLIAEKDVDNIVSYLAGLRRKADN